MKVVEIRHQPEPPAPEAEFGGAVIFSRYVDFYLTLLLHNGPGVLEAAIVSTQPAVILKAGGSALGQLSWRS